MKEGKRNNEKIHWIYNGNVNTGDRNIFHNEKHNPLQFGHKGGKHYER